jgi:hypothetical protein
MKILLKLTLLLVSYISIAQTQVSVSADIRGRSCGGGLGICSNTAISENKNSGVFAQKLSAKTILFSIDKSFLSKENEKSIAGKEFSKITNSEKINFTQEVDVFFDRQTMVKLGFDPKYYTIKKGIYPIIIDTDKVLITFTLSEK